ncbi:MAG: hypothetical protein V1897_17230 [Pseudomonadota bacterium]
MDLHRGYSGKTLGKKIENVEDLILWVKEQKARERLRNRQMWIDQIRNILAFHGVKDFGVTDDLAFTRRLSAEQRKELDGVSVNFVQPHVRTLTAKLNKSRPILECVPSTSDDSDIQAAKVGDKLVKSEWYQQRMDLKRIELTTWLAITGNAFVHQYFDRSAGPLNQGVPVGELRSKVMNSLKTLLEPHRTDISDCRWVIFSEKIPVDQAVELYGESYFQRTGEILDIHGGTSTLDDSSDVVTNSYLNIIGVSDPMAHNDPDFIELDYIYHMPTKWYPKGFYAVVGERKCYHVEDYPYPFLRRLPVLHFREVMSPWRFYGETSSSEVLKAEETYTRLRKVERDYHLDGTNHIWLRKRGTKVDDEELLSTQNRIIDYDGDTPPERISGVSVPGSIFSSLELAMKEGERTSGISDSSRSIVPSGITSGRALLALQEQDETRLGLTVQMAESEYEKWGQNTLLMVRAFYTEKRRYAFAGDALGGGVWFFDKAELADTQDIRTVPGSSLPQNKYAKQETVTQLFGQGILGNPQGEEAQLRARRMLEFGLVEDLYDDDAVHEQVAEKENLAMISMAQQAMEKTNGDPQMMQMFMQQIVMPVERYDKHLVHVKIHLRRLNGYGVRDNPMMYQAMAAHLDQHMAALQPQNQQQVTPEEAAATDETSTIQQVEGQEPMPQENSQIPTPQSEGDQQITPNDFPG